MEKFDCPICQNRSVRKDGKQKIIDGDEQKKIQRYRCTACDSRFNQNRIENILTDKECFTYELIKYLFKIKEDNFKTQKEKEISCNTKNLTKLISKRISENSSKPNTQFRFVKIREHKEEKIFRVSTDSHAIKKFLLGKCSFSEDDFLILLKSGSDLYFTNNDLNKDDFTEMRIDTPTYSIKIKKNTPIETNKFREQKIIVEQAEAKRLKRKGSFKNTNGVFSTPVYNKKPPC